MAGTSSNGPSWWQTLPGILTGLAAIVTAATGLIVTFNHSSRNEPGPESPPPLSSRTTPAPSGSSRTSGGTPAGALTLALPQLNRVTLAGGDTVVTVLSARIEPLDANRRVLKFGVRYTNAGRYPGNFWNMSFRLIVNDEPREPTNLLDELVAGGSSKEGEVVFELPARVKDVALQISAGDEKGLLPFTLP